MPTSAKLTPIERTILREACRSASGRRGIEVRRDPGRPAVQIRIGDRRLRGDRALHAVALLYSRGLIQQRELNRFVPTPAAVLLVRTFRRPPQSPASPGGGRRVA